MREADECRVRVADSPVQTEAELIAEHRAGCNAAEASEIRRHQVRIDDAPLLTEDLGMTLTAGGVTMTPVGSTAVRSFVEEAQPPSSCNR